MGQARNAPIAQSSYALIAVNGEYGTLSEIALGLKKGKKADYIYLDLILVTDDSIF